ncbi:hypothetical protein GJAV_G00022150 [Gymnothorax javanicus]|nr:hypothetical protein GJAV_G00022150 [Gymnothorax javanicus]
MEGQLWGDMSIEEMIEELNKDCQEAMVVVSENRMKLERVDSDLTQVSEERATSATSVHSGRTKTHWQRLRDLTGAKMKRLQETLISAQNIQKDVNSLQSWLIHIESKLSEPIVYHTCDSKEIQRKLTQQEDIQKDIEEHRESMESVLSFCEALLQDGYLCENKTQFDTIEQASRTLKQRWSNVLTASSERMKLIKETRSLWQKFMEDFSCFDGWLQAREETAASLSTSGLVHTAAKQELKKFEQVQENVTQLDKVIKQYQHLVQHDCIGDSCQLRSIMGNMTQRWDSLNDLLASGIHELKELIGKREAFEIPLSSSRHCSRRSLNAAMIEDTIHQGKILIQQTEDLDATVIEEECEELHRYCKEVFGRVHCYQEKIDGLQFETEEHGLSDLESSEEQHRRLSSDSLQASPQSHTVLYLQSEDSGQASPSSTDSIPLEWDPQYDLSQSPVFHSGDVCSENTYIQQPNEVLCTSHLFLLDWSDICLIDAESEATDINQPWDLVPEQVSGEESCETHNLNQGQDTNGHHRERLWVGLSQAGVATDEVQRSEPTVVQQTTDMRVLRLKQIQSEMTELWLKAKHAGSLTSQLQTQIKSRGNQEAKKEDHIRSQFEGFLTELTRVIGQLEQALDVDSGSKQQFHSSPTQQEHTVSNCLPRCHRGVGSVSSRSDWLWPAFRRHALWAALVLLFLLLVLFGLTCLMPPHPGGQQLHPCQIFCTNPASDIALRKWPTIYMSTKGTGCVTFLNNSANVNALQSEASHCDDRLL